MATEKRIKKNNKLAYRVANVKDAKAIAANYIKSIELYRVIKFGLPEVDDRFDIWRVPVLTKS